MERGSVGMERGGGERGACAGAGIDQHGVSFDQTERELAPSSKQGMEGERRLFWARQKDGADR